MSQIMMPQINKNECLTLQEMMNNYMNNNFNTITSDNELNLIFILANVEFTCYRKDINKLKNKIKKLNDIKSDLENEVNNYNILKRSYLCKINENRLLERTNNSNTTNILNPINIPNTTNNTSCCICMNNPNNFIYTTCGHMSCCQNCVYRIDRCPICRDNNGNFIEVYNAGMSS